MIVRISLLVLLFALLAFIAMDTLVWLAVPVFPRVLGPLGIGLLFIGFGLLLATGVLSLIKRVLGSISDYFSASQCTQRKLWFHLQQEQDVTQLFQLKAAKTTYLAELKKKRLLQKNNRKHLSALNKVISKELSAIKKHIPATQFKQLQTEHLHHKNNQDIVALLKLQQQIASILQTSCY